MNVFLWQFHTCHFNYIVVDYGTLNLFKQPDEGMNFALGCVEVVYTLEHWL